MDVTLTTYRRPEFQRGLPKCAAQWNDWAGRTITVGDTRLDFILATPPVRRAHP